ncbi:minor tail protein [Arthrobacter phage Crewmate]|uniref:Minor tail protein n=1 Tax=Arthrobacter phage Crewmate TaxID=2832317 RepID=A0AA48Y3H6_9CAUD|nr:minor tail protein [Arthrobacter phage Crewmate]UIW13270.1 minor tail protein [Arthrobacter phage Crewmate]WGH21193.1 minor tail protein [Arthrobacter phage ObiToo]
MALGTITTTAASLTLTTGEMLELQPGTNQVLTALDGWHSPPGTRRSGTERLWAHGSFSERGWREQRLISVGGHIFTATRSEAAAMTDNLSAALADGAAGKFIVNDADLGRRSATVYITGAPDVDWDGNVDIFFRIDMVAPDPRKYGDSLSAYTLAAAPGGGLVHDLFTGDNAGVLDFGDAGIPGTATLENVGTADTAPRFTISGYAPGFTITETNSGAKLVYADTVAAGQTLIIDAADGSVLLDGYADRSTYLTRRDWTRIPGRTRATYLFESPGNSGASMTLGASPAWW